VIAGAAMHRQFVELKLDLQTFDQSLFVSFLDDCLKNGICFESFASLGATPENKRKLYELNKECSADIPGRGQFYDFDDYVAKRVERQKHNQSGMIIAVDGKKWVGMAAVSDWRTKGFVFAEMTGVASRVW
jgi:hypothetical protein